MKTTFRSIIDVRDKTDKHIIITMVFLIASPILFYIYMQMQAAQSGLSLMDLVEGNPFINLSMVVAFTNSLAGYMLYLMRKHVKMKAMGEAVCLQVLILAAAQLLVMNMVFFLMLGMLYHKLARKYQLSLKQMKKSISARFIIKELSGSLVVLVLDGFCAILMYRLMF